MTAKEFSDVFDILYNNITSNQAPGLNSYEKSVFLTKAQNEIVKNYFLAESNPKGKGFDDNQKRQMDFSMLMSQSKLSPINNDSIVQLDPRSKVFKWPNEILYVVNESFNVGNYSNVSPAGDQPDYKFITNIIRQVIALPYGEYTRLMSKPYKYPLKYQAWRLISGQQDDDVTVEIILNNSDYISCNYNSQGIPSIDNPQNAPRYIVRYIRKPRPILLDNFKDAFGDTLTIDSKSGADNYDFNNPCELHESIHMEILQRAVELAKAAWASDQEQLANANLITTMGQRSE